MSTAIHGGFAGSQALWRLNIACLTHRIESIATTSAGNLDGKETGQTLTRVTDLRAQMTTVKLPFTPLAAVRNRVFAGCS